MKSGKSDVVENLLNPLANLVRIKKPFTNSYKYFLRLNKDTS